MAESPTFSRPLGNQGRGTRWWRQILDRKWKYGLFAHAQWKICNNPYLMAELPKFSRLLGNWVWGTRWWRQIFHQKWKCGHFAHATLKIRNITLIYVRSAMISACFGKSGSRNTMVTSDFRPEVEMRPFRACAMKKMQYSPYLWPNRQNCAMHSAIIIGTVRWLWTWLWGRYHVPQNAFLVFNEYAGFMVIYFYYCKKNLAVYNAF